MGTKRNIDRVGSVRSRKGSPYFAFFEEISNLASPSMVGDRILADRGLKKSKKLRKGAARLIVALLPETLPAFERLLRDCKSPLWYEVHFILFVALVRKDLGRDDQARVLRLVHGYLSGVSSSAGYAAWMAGDLLGEQWLDAETVKMLEELLLNARHPAGREAALHGIQHALQHASIAEGRRLFAVIQKVATEDRSGAVRLSARLAVRGSQCGPPMSQFQPKDPGKSVPEKIKPTRSKPNK